MTKQSKMLQLLTQVKRDFDIGEPRFPHLKLKVSDISPKQDAIELYIRAKDILWNSNLPQRQVADIILDLGAAVQLKDSKNILQEIVKLFPALSASVAARRLPVSAMRFPSMRIPIKVRFWPVRQK